ncbi:MAG: septum site-determining protein MinC [Coxiellaceae bacterium]|nr:septum site-determining protein MinC [Coxiellaceae bacterium]
MTTSLIKELDNLEFKADFFPMTVIKLTTSNLASIKSQIATTIIAAPNYFKNAPVVIDINAIDDTTSIDLEAICQLLRDQMMIPVGVRGLDKSAENDAISQGLAIMKAPQSEKKKPEPSLTSGNTSATSAKKKETQPEPTKGKAVNTKMVYSPVRSGQQLYARNGDLVVTAAVNAGGECFADGNIHIYGPLRGKALAGANGDEEARIFCESLDAELVSIAGHYLTNDKIKTPKTKHTMIQIYLKNGRIQIEGI